ncbi:adenosine 5'-monophosphoramidase HINT3-like [Cloeon dipterum]|uniref:adenosine 5'-monophosphoramidase HINT3-like n=1 Tax=Cloeon dipterum TaxID=197152 RepID=UPI00321FEB74
MVLRDFKSLRNILKTNRKIAVINTSSIIKIATEMAVDRDKCMFCRIYDGKERNDIYFQDEDFVVFEDHKPAAKHHLLIVTKEHIPNAKALTKKNIAQRLMELGRQMLLERGGDITDARYGYHWPPFNSINHLHLHAISPASTMTFLNKSIFKENSWWFVSPEYVVDRLSE